MNICFSPNVMEFLPGFCGSGSLLVKHRYVLLESKARSIGTIRLSE
jgi:hypothetical protein